VHLTYGKNEAKIPIGMVASYLPVRSLITMGIPIEWEMFETYLLYDCHRKPETLPTCRRTFLRVKKYFEDKELTKTSVYSFFDHLRKNGNKNSTINDYIKYIHHVGKLLSIPDLTKITYLPEEEQIFDVLTPDEIRRLLSIKPKRVRDESRLNTYWSTVIETLLATGMRREELCNILKEDFKEDHLIVRRSKNRTDRMCKLSSPLSKRIKALGDNKYVFGHGDRKLCSWLINRELKFRTDLLGIKKHITAHTLRRTSATEAASKGINLSYIQRFLGHKNVNTTSKYIQVDDAALQAVSKSLTVNEGTINLNDIYLRLQNVAQEFIPNFKVELKKTSRGIRLFIAE